MNKYIFSLIKVAIVTFLGIHLFGVHARLIFHINPMKIESSGIINPYSFTAFTDENTLGSSVFAIAYSLISVFVIMVFDNKKKMSIVFLSIFAFFDGFGVFIFYYMDIQNIFLLCSIYYALFTFFIVFAVGLISHEEENPIKAEMTPDLSKDDMILELLEKGEKQKDIASKMSVSQSYVSRINNKND